MGNIQTRKLIILIILFLLVTCLINTKSDERAESKGVQLSKAITNIEGWKFIEHVKLNDKIVDSLELDDYAFMKFSNRKDIVTIYIGYYFASKKVGAAHDPLVCFPGQGWEVSNIRRKEAVIKNDCYRKLQYATMNVEKNQQQELILYWFQSYDKSHSSTFFQKLSTFKNRMQSKDGDNAFVRVNISSEGMPIENAESIALDFIRAFYPVFIEYVQG